MWRIIKVTVDYAQGLVFVVDYLCFSGFLKKGRSPEILIEKSKSDNLRGVALMS